MATHSSILAWETPWTIACQCAPPVGFSRQEYWSGVPLPSLETEVQFSSVQSLSRFQLFATPWTIQSTEFSRPEYWNGYPIPSPGYLPNPRIEPRSPALQADSLPSKSPGKPRLEWVSYPFFSRLFRPRN